LNKKAATSLSPRLKNSTYSVFSENGHAGNFARVDIVDDLDRLTHSDWNKQLTGTDESTKISAICYLNWNHQPYRSRWFNRSGEIQYCGHAALATASKLDSVGLLDRQILLSFPSGEYKLKKTKGLYWFSDDSNYSSDQIDLTDTGQFLDAVVLDTVGYVGNNGYLLLRLEDNLDLQKMSINVEALLKNTRRALIVTSLQTLSGKIDYAIRYFAPQYGIDEDPATGSANHIAATYWFPITQRTALTGYQASPEGGIIYSEICDGKIWIGGAVKPVDQEI
jgi:PhzF family phenazine biosynthesis protein